MNEFFVESTSLDRDYALFMKHEERFSLYFLLSKKNFLDHVCMLLFFLQRDFIPSSLINIASMHVLRSFVSLSRSDVHLFMLMCLRHLHYYYMIRSFIFLLDFFFFASCPFCLHSLSWECLHLSIVSQASLPEETSFSGSLWRLAFKTFSTLPSSSSLKRRRLTSFLHLLLDSISHRHHHDL